MKEDLNIYMPISDFKQLNIMFSTMQATKLYGDIGDVVIAFESY